MWLNRFDYIIPILFATGVWGLGWLLEIYAPGLHTTRWQMLGWGFFVSTTVLFHGTSCINSLAHLMGRRRFQTSDDSRNSWILTLITLGEGWHNNHHRYMNATRQVFYWWEFDPTYYGLKLLSWTGLIWDLKSVPASVLAEAEAANHASSIAAAQRAALTHPEFSSFKKVVPAAAAMAMATRCTASNGVAPRAQGRDRHPPRSSPSWPSRPNARHAGLRPCARLDVAGLNPAAPPARNHGRHHA